MYASFSLYIVLRRCTESFFECEIHIRLTVKARFIGYIKKGFISSHNQAFRRFRPQIHKIFVRTYPKDIRKLKPCKRGGEIWNFRKVGGVYIPRKIRVDIFLNAQDVVDIDGARSPARLWGAVLKLTQHREKLGCGFQSSLPLYARLQVQKFVCRVVWDDGEARHLTKLHVKLRILHLKPDKRAFEVSDSEAVLSRLSEKHKIFRMPMHLFSNAGAARAEVYKLKLKALNSALRSSFILETIL